MKKGIVPKTMEKKIGYKDLSKPLKVAVIMAWIIAGFWGAVILSGIIGFLMAFLMSL